MLIARNAYGINIPGNKQFFILYQFLKLVKLFINQLLEILISNLLNNAFRYNVKNGSVNIELANNSFTVSNNSFLPVLDEQKVFQRFYRHADTKQEGNGLGLSIVKQICTVAGYSVTYKYLNNHHNFIIAF